MTYGLYYVKAIIANPSEGVKLGVGTSSARDIAPTLWVNISWSDPLSVLQKTALLNARYAYMNGIKAGISYTEENGACSLDGVTISWEKENA